MILLLWECRTILFRVDVLVDNYGLYEAIDKQLSYPAVNIGDFKIMM